MKKLFLFTLIFLLLTGCKEKTVAASHIDLEVALDSNYNTVSTSVFVDGQKIETVVLNNDNEIAGYAYREYNDNGQLVKESKFDSNKELQEMCLTEWTGNIASSVSCYLKDGTSYERVSSIIEDSKIIERTYKTETSYIQFTIMIMMRKAELLRRVILLMIWMVTLSLTATVIMNIQAIKLLSITTMKVRRLIPTKTYTFTTITADSPN